MDVTVEPQLVQWLNTLGAGQDTIDKVHVALRQYFLYQCPHNLNPRSVDGRKLSPWYQLL